MADSKISALTASSALDLTAEFPAAYSSANEKWTARQLANSRVLQRTYSQQVVSSSTETDVFTYTIAAGFLGATGALRLTIIGTYLNNSGGNRTLTVKIYLGSTVMYTVASANIAAAAGTRGFRMTCIMGNRNNTAVQDVGGDMAITTNPLFSSATALVGTMTLYGTATEDTTSSKVFKVSVTHSAIDASLEFDLQQAYLELL